jgi:4-amino-4-deoxy-L-arabinose transferase-like glycosyltransferase
MNNKIVISLLIGFTLISLFLHFFKWGEIPACLNADELSYGYNSYSLLKTGRDEFGTAWPLRIKSFGDYKLPLYSYITIPFIAVFGLSDLAVRLPTIIAAILLIWAGYFLALSFFNNQRLALITAFLLSTSPWLNGLFSHHAHEAVLTTLFLTLGLFFLLNYIKQNSSKNALLFILFSSLALYTYHFARLFYGIYLLIFIYELIKKPVSQTALFTYFAILLLFLIPFTYSELQTPPSRLNHLSITNHPGPKIIANELATEFKHSPFNNYYFILGNEILNRYFDYFSPRFLTIRGDENQRFGFEGISLITWSEFALLLLGCFWLVSNHLNYKKSLLLLSLLLSPVAGALTFQTNTQNRVFFMIIPLILIVAYGYDRILDSHYRYRLFLIAGLTLGFLFYNIRSWEFFFFHYNRRGINIRSWDCGYKEIAKITKENYSRYQKFYITKEAGQAYIGLLFYQQYNPTLFQKYSQRLPPDQNGFLNITGFDKYIFDLSSFDIKDPKNNLYFMSESEGKKYNLVPDQVNVISKGTEQLYWLYPRFQPINSVNQ